MSEMRSDASLRGKVRHLAKEHGLKPQEVLQMYLFEHLLMRLAVSSCADKFVLKGGLLISSMTGIYQRTTMDMDATVVGMSMDGATNYEGSARDLRNRCWRRYDIRVREDRAHPRRRRVRELARAPQGVIWKNRRAGESGHHDWRCHLSNADKA